MDHAMLLIVDDSSNTASLYINSELIHNGPLDEEILFLIRQYLSIGYILKIEGLNENNLRDS